MEFLVKQVDSDISGKTLSINIFPSDRAKYKGLRKVFGGISKGAEISPDNESTADEDEEKGKPDDKIEPADCDC